MSHPGCFASIDRPSHGSSALAAQDVHVRGSPSRRVATGSGADGDAGMLTQLIANGRLELGFQRPKSLRRCAKSASRSR